MHQNIQALNAKLAGLPTWADIFGFIASEEKLVGHREAVRRAVEKFNLRGNAKQ